MRHQILPRFFPYVAIAILLSSPVFASAQSAPTGVQDLSSSISSLTVADDQYLASFGSFIVRLLGNIHLFGIVNLGSIRTASSADTTPPSTPTNLTAVASSSSELDLSWTASTDNVGVTGYKVFRAGSQVGTSTQTTYADTGLTASTTYTYTVKAFDAAGNVSTASNIATSTTGTWADGFANAPAGTVQYPNLLQGYVARPPWRVAGVDYAVGVPSGTTLSDPSTISISGVFIDSSGHTVQINTNNPVTISGIDFSLDGGWQLLIGNHITSNNVTVTDSNFAIGSNGNAMVSQASGSNTIFTYDTFNGHGLNDNGNGSVFNLNGGMTLEYCLVENEFGDFIDYGANNTVQFDLFVNDGQGVGSHPDWLQLGGGTYNQTFEFDTFLQTTAAEVVGTQGISFGGFGTWNTPSAIGSYNTMIAQANSSVSFFYSTGGFTTGDSAIITNNYVDPTGAGSLTWPGSDNAYTTYSNNWNMVTGAAANF